MNNNKKIAIPNGIAEGILVSYLHTATLCTTNIAAYREFYVGATKMEMLGPLEITIKEKVALKDLWHIDESIDFDIYHFYRATVPSLIQMRVLHLKTPTPHIHKSYNAYELGSFSLGFPSSDAKGMHQRMESYKVGTMASTQIGDIVRADGKPGKYMETIYQAPDFLHVVGIERLNYIQLSPCDPNDGFGGPGYSALVVKNTDADMAYYNQILGLYTHLDAYWETAEGSALGTGPGVPYRFTMLYAPESNQNFIILLQFQDGNEIDVGVPSNLPNQGLGMYTFQTLDVAKVVEKARTVNPDSIISPIRMITDPILGKGKACVLKTPSGFNIEIFENEK